MYVVQWSDTGYDWENDAAAVVGATLRHLRSGSVILLHDGFNVRTPGSQTSRSNTVEALPAILNGGLKVGFKFVSVCDFLPGI
jgi:peptidoglycan/xylan/chitin deacetylase (PgdA/CDA1 family)